MIGLIYETHEIKGEYIYYVIHMNVHVKCVASYRSLASISFSSSSSSACFLRSLEDSLSTRSSSLSMSCRIFARARVVLRARRRRAELVLYPDLPVRESSSGGGSGSVRFTFLPVPEGEPRLWNTETNLDKFLN